MMIPARKRKILILLFSLSILSIATALVLYALRQNISLFYTPTQAAAGEVPQQQPIRMGGMVEQGSIIRSPKSLDVQFKVTDLNRTITVTYTGILPDLFREGQGVVAEGQLIDNQHFRASQVLAKHDANYMPPEVKAALASKNNTNDSLSRGLSVGSMNLSGSLDPVDKPRDVEIMGSKKLEIVGSKKVES